MTFNQRAELIHHVCLEYIHSATFTYITVLVHSAVSRNQSNKCSTLRQLLQVPIFQEHIDLWVSDIYGCLILHVSYTQSCMICYNIHAFHLETLFSTMTAYRRITLVPATLFHKSRYCHSEILQYMEMQITIQLRTLDPVHKCMHEIQWGTHHAQANCMCYSRFLNFGIVLSLQNQKVTSYPIYNLKCS